MERTVWPIAALAWLYLAAHSAHRLGIDVRAVYRGPYDLLHGLAPYPSTASFSAWKAATHQPFYVHPPAAPIVLSPFGLLREKVAGALFVVISASVFAVGLYLLARRTPFPALIMLGAALSLPVTTEIALGNADLLCAGFVALAFATTGRSRALFTCLGLAIKPTVWAVVVLLGVPGLVGFGAAVGLNLIGLAVIHDSGRFFHDVIPYIAHGQIGIPGVSRTSLADLASSVGIPHSDASIVTGIALLAALGWIVLRGARVGGDSARFAPLVVVLVLTLSTYSYTPYAVYLVALLPLLRPRHRDLPLLGVALYFICAPDIWSSNGFPHALNVALDYKGLAGLLLLIPVAARPKAVVT
ncbi:MAG TPA: glycosyltransferase family 87 protein [Gaiellaceae bacterium]